MTNASQTARWLVDMWTDALGLCTTTLGRLPADTVGQYGRTFPVSRLQTLLCSIRLRYAMQTDASYTDSMPHLSHRTYSSHIRASIPKSSGGAIHCRSMASDPHGFPHSPHQTPPCVQAYVRERIVRFLEEPAFAGLLGVPQQAVQRATAAALQANAASTAAQQASGRYLQLVFRHACQ